MREGCPVIFVPSFMQRGDAWSDTAVRLGQRYPSVCLDFTTHDFEGRMAEVLEAAAPGSVVVAYSLGARVALHAGLRDPDVFGGLVLVGASAGIEDEAEREQRRVADEQLAAWMESRPIEEVVDRWERTPVLGTQAPAVVAAQRAGRLSHTPADLARLLRSAGQAALAPVWDRLPALHLPTLCVAGALDHSYAAAAERMAGLLPNGEVALVPDAGHAPQLERPDEFADGLVEFLDHRIGEG